MDLTAYIIKLKTK